MCLYSLLVYIHFPLPSLVLQRAAYLFPLIQEVGTLSLSRLLQRQRSNDEAMSLGVEVGGAGRIKSNGLERNQ